ncbi:MAG: hypothetical protein VXZ96_11865 [Myxococcota bacterium]|nr:hypothetical protein [Myxococcota bacterium]
MKLSLHNTFLPSTQRATQWATETLQILQPTHPLSGPAALFEAFQSHSLQDLITQLSSEPNPPTRLIQVLEKLNSHIGGECATPIQRMVTLRHCALELKMNFFQRAVDRWFYNGGFHSIRSLGNLKFDIQIEQVVSNAQGCYVLTDCGDVHLLSGHKLCPITVFESLDVQQISAAGVQLAVLDEQATVWELSEGQPKRLGQWEMIKKLLATPAGPIVRMDNHVVFKDHIFSVPINRHVVSDGEYLFTNEAGLSVYHLTDGSQLSLWPDSQGVDEQMMADAIFDMATTAPGLRFLMVLKFWTRRISHIFRLLQQIGDVLYVSPAGDHAIGLNEDTLQSWSIEEGRLILKSEMEITDSWSVNGVVPIHPQHQAVILQTASGISAIDFEQQLEVRLLIQPAFAIRIYSIGQPFRFWMNTGESWHMCRFDRQGVFHDNR